jgi:hypothetical protein
MIPCDREERRGEINEIEKMGAHRERERKRERERGRERESEKMGTHRERERKRREGEKERWREMVVGGTEK